MNSYFKMIIFLQQEKTNTIKLKYGLCVCTGRLSPVQTHEPYSNQLIAPVCICTLRITEIFDHNG